MYARGPEDRTTAWMNCCALAPPSHVKRPDLSDVRVSYVAIGFLDVAIDMG